MIARSYCHFRASPEAEIGQGTGDRYIVSMPAAKVLGQPFHHAISWTPEYCPHCSTAVHFCTLSTVFNGQCPQAWFQVVNLVPAARGHQHANTTTRVRPHLRRQRRSCHWHQAHSGAEKCRQRHRAARSAAGFLRPPPARRPLHHPLALAGRPQSPDVPAVACQVFTQFLTSGTNTGIGPKCGL